MAWIQWSDVSRNYVDFKWLLPFVATIAIFLVFPRMHDEPSVLACVVKAAPILSLAVFAWVRGVQISFRKTTATYIFLALILSAIGDVFIQLKSQGFFIYGIGAFGLSQLLFTFGFGFQQLDWLLLAPILGLGGIYYTMLYPMLKEHPDQVFVLAVLGYLFLISAMIWRAFSRHKSALTRSKKGVTVWTLVGCVGAVSFAVSDCALAWWMFGKEFPNADSIVMGTYYLAQLCLTLSLLHGDTNGSVKVKTKYDEKKISSGTKTVTAQVQTNGKGVAEVKTVETPGSPKSPGGSKKKHY